MSIENDETLQVFIDESLEHLADIDEGLLTRYIVPPIPSRVGRDLWGLPT